MEHRVVNGCWRCRMRKRGAGLFGIVIALAWVDEVEAGSARSMANGTVVDWKAALSFVE